MTYGELMARFDAIIRVMKEMQYVSEEFYFVCESYHRKSFIVAALENGYKLEFTRNNFARFSRA